MVTGDWVKPGATVIDVGINRVEGGRQGGGSSATSTSRRAARVAGAITPVPGGVGPMTIACLLANTLTACCRINGLPEPAGPDAVAGSRPARPAGRVSQRQLATRQPGRASWASSACARKTQAIGVSLG